MAYINGNHIRLLANFEGAFDRLRTWEKTFTGEETGKPILVEKDEWLKQHRNDEGLVVVLFPDSELSAPSSGNILMYGFARNVESAPDSGYQFTRYLTSTGTFSNYFATTPVNNSATSASRAFLVDSQGNLKIAVSSSYKVAPAKYKIFAFSM